MIKEIRFFVKSGFLSDTERKIKQIAFISCVDVNIKKLGGFIFKTYSVHAIGKENCIEAFKKMVLDLEKMQ